MTKAHPSLWRHWILFVDTSIKLKMKFYINIQVGLYIIFLFACQEQKVLESIKFESNSNIEYRFAIIDSIDNEYYKLLKSYVNLDSIIGDDTDPTEIAISLTDYTHKQWSHNGINTPSKFEGLTILREAKEGKEFRCVEYSILLTELLIASQIPARQIGLKTQNVEIQESGAGHVAVEYYDNNHKKWIYADAQTNVVAFNDKIPLNSVELQFAIRNKMEVTVRNQNKRYVENFTNWIGQYLYYFDTSFDQRVMAQNRLSYDGKTKLMLTPIGSKNPTKFQIYNEINNVIYTNSVVEFYPEM